MLSEGKINTIQIEMGKDECLGFCGDLHADYSGPDSRIDDYQHTVICKLDDILKKCLIKNVKVLVFAGDMFSRIAVPHECVNAVGEAFMNFKRNGVRVFSIVGNHDIARNNMDRLIKSPLKTLFTFEVVEHINLNIRIVLNKKTLITPVDYVQTPVGAYEKAKYNILIAHMFFNSTDLFSSGSHNITESDVINWGYDCIMLGHDHVPYPIIRVGKTDIIRPGSVMRATSHEYNFNRIPCFYVLKNPSEYDVSNFEKVDIEAKPFEEIASNSVINRKSMSTVIGLQGILSDLADRIVGVENKDGVDRIVEIVKNDKELPYEVRSLLLTYFQEHNIVI